MTDTFILQELITDNLPFTVHNVKIDTFICQRDLPLLFLTHYDSLPKNIKTDKPLGDFFAHATQKMTTHEANALLGLPPNTLKPATHVKITGTSVIVLHDFPLALHLQFTNTAKETQIHYGDDLPQFIQGEAKNFLLSGNVNVLHKSTTKTLISVDLSDDEYLITPQESYSRLPNSHALAVTQILNTLKYKSPQALDYLTIAVVAKVMEHFDNHVG
ncbi:hypothetical protein [Moraxella oblonga]|uniref:hypothetical protein n=1 Tax=Moraxella oblonga TaxID=200413 RepID=UPI000836A57A|nr:hypothetical protein [Moraxella oblonga]